MNSASGVCSVEYSDRGNHPCTWSQAMNWSTTPDASSWRAKSMVNFGSSVRSSWNGTAVVTCTARSSFQAFPYRYTYRKLDSGRRQRETGHGHRQEQGTGCETARCVRVVGHG